MKNFNWKRFGLTLGYDFSTGRRLMLRSMMYMLLAYLFLFFLMHFFHPYVGYDVQPDVEEELALMRIQAINKMVAGIATIMAAVFSLVTVCAMFGREQSKQGRILMLMLPASNLEKFLSRWVFMVAVTLDGTVVSFSVADLLHMFACWTMGSPVQSAFPNLWEVIENTFLYSGSSTLLNVMISLISILGWFTFHALFLLGATLFRKHQFLLTASALAIVLPFYTYFANWLSNTYNTEYDPATFLWLKAGHIALYMLYIGISCWLAYRFFCRWQVVTRKFVSL